MKNYSAVTLLRLAMSGKHLAYCPHINVNISCVECKCWRYEVEKWENRIKVASINRVHKARPKKAHLIKDKVAGTVYCGKSNAVVTTDTITDDTCFHCQKRLNSPAKKSNRKKLNNIWDQF